uniref:LRRNT domain-containing protein n=1 Tax=Astyanax mexicanus TaxID=7994 RepID=A0A8B9RDD5_ASTMX
MSLSFPFFSFFLSLLSLFLYPVSFPLFHYPCLSFSALAGCPARCVCDEQLVVQCAGQRLAEFPAELPLATRQLILSDNGIGELPALQLNYLADLVYLDCSNNSLSELSESTFGNLRKLAYLDLSFNALARIDARTFGPLASLVMLRMTDNPGLSEIDARAFAENAALQVLDVSRNNLTVLNASALMALPALRALGLSGNPWSCDCQTEDLCLWMHVEGFKLLDLINQAANVLLKQDIRSPRTTTNYNPPACNPVCINMNEKDTERERKGLFHLSFQCCPVQ